MHQENVAALFHGISFIHIRVQKVRRGVFLLSIARPLASHSLFEALGLTLGNEIESGLITTQPWSAQCSSTGYTLTKSAELEMKGLPCNFCTSDVVEYLLGPFCLVRTHDTIPDEREKPCGETISVYKCSVWFNKLKYIPYRLGIKRLPLRLANPRSISAKNAASLSLMEVDIAAYVN